MLFLIYIPSLAVLHKSCSRADILEEDKFNVELVVQCVRVSDMPQTHHHALLLLGTVASMFPVSYSLQTVIHHTLIPRTQ